MPDPVTWIVVAVTVAAVAALMVRLSLWPKMDLVETHETTVGGAAVLLCTASYVVLMALFGICITVKMWLDHGPVGLLALSPLAAVLLFPLVSAGLVYLRIPAMLRKTCEADMKPGLMLRAAAQEAGEALGLYGVVDVRLSGGKQRYRGPTTFGRWGMRPVLVVPSDLEAAAAIASGGKTDVARALMRFVFLHELAHVRNGDYHIHSWVSAFLWTMKWWPLVLIPLLVAYSVLAGTREGLVIFGEIAWLSIIITLLLFLSWRPLQRHREKLADARAASCLVPSEVELLIAPDKKDLSPLENLAAYLEIRQGLTPKASAAGGNRPSSRRLLVSAVRLFRCLLKPVPLRASAEFLRRLAGTHPLSDDRRTLLTSGELLAESRQQVSYGATASVFASVGLAFLSLIVVVTMPSAFLNLPSTVAPLVGLLVIAVFTTAALLCMPFRNVTTATMPLRVAVPALLGRSLLGGASSAAVSLAVGLPALVAAPAWVLEFMRVWIPMCLLLSAGTFAISILLAMMMRYGVQCRALLPRASLLRSTFLAVIMAYTPMAAMVIVGALSWDAVGDLWRESPAWLASVFIVALCGAVWTGVAFGRRYIHSALDTVRVPREMWKEPLVVASVTMAVFAALAWGGVSLARAVNDILLRTYPLFRPWADAPALAGIAAALLLFIRAVQRRDDAMLSPWFELTRLLGYAGQSLPPATRDWLVGYVALCHAETGGYAWCPGARSDLDSTWNALSILAATGTAPPNPVLDVQWVLRHQVAGGGFARREGGTHSPSATRAAMECLGYLQHDLSGEKREAAIRWVMASQKHDGGFSDGAEPNRSRIEATSDAVACLQQLGGLERIDRAAALRFTSSAWAKSARTVDETYWVVYAHCGLGGLDDAVATAVRMWCLTRVPWFLRLNPKKYPAPLYKVLWIISQLPGEADESLVRLTALIRARVQRVMTDSPQR